MILTPPMQGFLAALIRSLEQQGCAPVILRNYEGLPNEIGNDLDIFVLPERIQAAEDVFLECGHQWGGELVHRHKRGYFVALWIRFPGSDDCLHLDLYYGALTWHGFEFLPASRLLAGRKWRGELPIPRKAHEALLLVAVSLLWGGYLKKRYLPWVRDCLDDTEESKEFDDCIEQAFGESGHALLGKFRDGVVDGGSDLPMVKSLRKALGQRELSNRPLQAIKGWLHHWSSEIYNYLNPPGLIVTYPSSDLDFLTEVKETLTAETGSLFGEIKVLPQARGGKDKLRSALLAFYFSGRNYLAIRAGKEWTVAGRKMKPAGNDARASQIANAIRQELLGRQAPPTKP